jgi:hypothetical protein
MKRRSFFTAAAASGLAVPLTAAEKEKALIELTYIRMRNSSANQARRIRSFAAEAVVPALKRAGTGPVGLFTNLIGEDSPTVLLVTSYANFGAMEAAENALMSDKEMAAEIEAFYKNPALPYQRVEKILLRGFETMPDIELLPAKEGKGGRVFELRVYESNTAATLKRKVGMFDNGEIEIFRKYGLQPVFFGETLIGPKMPNLTYMIGFESWANREEAWGKFVRSPEWQKLSKTPGLSDAEIVSNISNTLYRALPGSDIK